MNSFGRRAALLALCALSCDKKSPSPPGASSVPVPVATASPNAGLQRQPLSPRGVQASAAIDADAVYTGSADGMHALKRSAP